MINPISFGVYCYTYVLNNPLKYTDPSGYTYYWKRYVWQREVTESMNFNSGGGGVSRRDIHSYFDYINSMHSDPRGWSYNESTEEFYNGRTGEVVDARDPVAAFDYMGVDYRPVSSMEEAYEFLGYSRTVLGTDKYGSQEVLYENLETGALKIKKEAFWKITGSYYNQLNYFDGLVAFDSNAAFKFAQRYRNGGNPFQEGGSLSLTAMFAYGGGWQFEIGVVWDNHGGRRGFFNSGPTIGYDLSAGIQRKYIKSNTAFNVDMYSGYSTSIDASLLIADWTITGGDNTNDSYMSSFRYNYTESGWGISIGSPVGFSWQMGNTILW